MFPTPRPLAIGSIVLCGLLLGAPAGSLAGPTTGGARRPPLPRPTPTAALTIPFVRYQLPNGLTVILHEDHSQPVVVVNLGYQVGSRDERAGRTGFAHLFEHLMFMGTPRVPLGQFDEWMEREGGWNNASTSQDRTVYYDVAPSHALPLLLWMEADRLAVLGQQITDDKLTTQRDIVRNERRQEIENQPYESAQLRLPELLFPPGHPYHHPVIGSHADLVAASTADVRAFFEQWYRPSNAILVVAGDFEPGATKGLVERYFGSLPASPPARRAPPPATEARLSRVVRETLEDHVTLPKIMMVWPSPRLFAAGDADLDLLAAIATTGKASRLYQDLVYDRRIAQSVAAYQRSLQLRSWFVVEAVARENVSLDELERALDAQLARLRTELVSDTELRRAQNEYEMRLVAQLQSPTERASMLGAYQAFVGDPGYVMKDLSRYRRATRESVRRAVQQTLRPDARVILRIVPHGQAPPPPRKTSRAHDPHAEVRR